MARLMRAYEAELRNPIRSFLLPGGQLARCLLIQLQKVKVDSAGALLEMDQVLRANELSLAATAAVPALAAVWLLGIGARRALFSRSGAPPPDPRRAAAPLRSAFADAEDALVLLAAAEEEEEEEEEEGSSGSGGEEEGEEQREELSGRALFELGRALAAVDSLLGLGPSRRSSRSRSRLSRVPLLPDIVLRALSGHRPRAIGELEGADSSSSSSSPAAASASEALPLVGGVLSSRSWRAGDAVRCRSGLVALAGTSASARARAEAAARLARSSALLK